MAESLQRNLLSTFLKSRDAWEQVRDKISDSVFEQDPYATKIVQLTDEFYSKDKEATRVSIPIILEQVDIRVAAVKQKETLTYLIKELDASEVSVENVVDLAIELKRKEMGDRLGAALLNGGSKEDQHRLMQEYQDLLEMQTFDESEAEEEYNNVSVSEVVSNVVNPEAMLKLAPKSLNDALGGGALGGHKIVIIARPETGKTAMMCTLMHGFALQEASGIYFGNEDPIMSVMQRTMSCIAGMTKAEIASDPARAQELLAKRNWNKLRFIPLNPGSLWEVEKYVKRYRPRWIIVDQMRNMSMKAGTKTEAYEEIAKGLRNIAKRYNCTVIAVTQAGDSASNKLVLDQGDVDGSNTGIPGACDVILGIGVNAEYEKQGLRMFGLSKNKLGGNHNHFPVKLRADISRYESV